MGLSKVFPCLRKKQAQKLSGDNGGAGNTNTTSDSSTKPNTGTAPNTGSTPPKIPPIDNIPDQTDNQETKPPGDETSPKDDDSSENISARVWNRAYDELAKADDTKALVEAYAKVIPETTKSDDEDKTIETGNEQAVAEMNDTNRRQELMEDAVKAGTQKIASSKSAKATSAVNSVSSFVLKFKDVIDLAVGTNPQAALPWAGVCIGLQARSPHNLYL